MGVDARGVDLDVPLVKMTLEDVLAILKQNGAERAAKSVARWMVIQRKEYRIFAQFCAEQSGDSSLSSFNSILKKSQSRLVVSDAGSEQFWNSLERPLDFIYSEDGVRAHSAEAGLDNILASMSNYLSDDGIAIIRPNIFTGITGGHHLEWYRYTLLSGDTSHTPRRSEPWDHLRKDNFPANTYLNRLSLADFRRKFQERFDILEEKTMLPNLGREFLTDEIRRELATYPDEELFSNKVLFVLRKRR